MALPFCNAWCVLANGGGGGFGEAGSCRVTLAARVDFCVYDRDDDEM